MPSNTRVGLDRGASPPGPLKSHFRFPGAHTANHAPVTVEDLVYRSLPRGFCDEMTDFAGTVEGYDLQVPLLQSTGANNQTTTVATVGAVRIPKGGVITSISVTAQTTLTANDTNFLTFTVTNLLGAGAGSAAILAATAPNTTQVTGGATLTANVPFALTLNGTAANLRVAAGDLVTVTSTPTGTLANAVLGLVATIHIATLPSMWTPQIVRTAGSPLVAQTANVADGEAQLQLSATNEVNFAGITWGDQLVIPAANPCIFECRAKFGTVTTAQDCIWGFASAFNNTLASTTIYAWFRLSASLNLTVELNDGTTTQLAVAAAIAPGTQVAVTASTYNLYRIDMTDLGHIRFFIDDNKVADLASAAFATVSPGLLQPIAGIRKASGTGIVAMTVDMMRCFWYR